MGLLDSAMGGMGGMQNPFAQYQQMQANPFTRQIPGMEYLSGMGQQGMGGGMGQMGGLGGDVGQGMENAIPTDFAGVPPGLPNLPENMQGFGFGQTAPKMNINSNIRQALIGQLLSQIMPGINPGLGTESAGGMGGNNVAAALSAPAPYVQPDLSGITPRAIHGTGDFIANPLKKNTSMFSFPMRGGF